MKNCDIIVLQILIILSDVVVLPSTLTRDRVTCCENKLVTKHANKISILNTFNSLSD